MYYVSCCVYNIFLSSNKRYAQCGTKVDCVIMQFHHWPWHAGLCIYTTHSGRSAVLSGVKVKVKNNALHSNQNSTIFHTLSRIPFALQSANERTYRYARTTRRLVPSNGSLLPVKPPAASPAQPFKVLRAINSSCCCMLVYSRAIHATTPSVSRHPPSKSVVYLSFFNFLFCFLNWNGTSYSVKTAAIFLIFLFKSVLLAVNNNAS